ncbi:MAG: two-component system response regulator [Hydrogenophilaceae bacterium]|nr:two-component system response regulator [Hydrogenophilaceae bacterium]
MAKNSILIVDDQAENIEIISALLGEQYRVLSAQSAEAALELITRGNLPDLVLLDVEMPGMDGYEACQRLKSMPGTSHIPVIFLTGRSSIEDETYGLKLGAVDYITKPISPPILEARLNTHLSLKDASDQLRNQNTLLEQRVAERTAELLKLAEDVILAQDTTILDLASLAETRDNETGNHILRTQNYVKALASHVKDQPRFRTQLPWEQINLLYKSAPLHDVGKVGIPDHILLKPGKLDPDEFETMKTHTTLGRDAILAAEAKLDSSTSFLRVAREIAYAHHEKWDGSGYPLGLSGDAIPLSARLMAVADVYDALISKRVYKPAFPHEKAVEIISESKGSHFDPDLADAFIAIADQFNGIAQRFKD